MSKRLQVVLEEREWREIAAIARRKGQTISEWVRTTLRAGRRSESTMPVDKKLAAIRLAARMQGPTGDINQMLREIEAGYGNDDE